MTTFSIAASTTGNTSAGGTIVGGGSVADTGGVLTFSLDATPSLIADNGDYVVISIARPNAVNPISRTLVLTPDQAALIDSYVAQTGCADVIDAIFRQVQCLISGIVGSSNPQQPIITAAVTASLATMQQE